jgi:uncharacterized lipoprotein YehR (DUF1307 family)
MTPYRIVVRILIISIVCCGLPGCAGDPRAALLEPYVEINPSPKAIVGLWNWKSPGYSITILFRKNGTGLYSWNKNEKPLSFTYEYTGNGIWRISLQHGTVFKISKGHLLMKVYWSQIVFDRQPLDSAAPSW